MLVPEVRVGKVRIRQMPIAFADVAPFKHFGLTDRPALLLGMDALSCFRHVEIDFPNRQVRFLMPRPGETIVAPAHRADRGARGVMSAWAGDAHAEGSMTSARTKLARSGFC